MSAGKVGIRYHIVGEESPEVFVSEIYGYIQQGYKLHGGMAVDNGTFYQALTKPDGAHLIGGRRTRKRNVKNCKSRRYKK